MKYSGLGLSSGFGSGLVRSGHIAPKTKVCGEQIQIRTCFYPPWMYPSRPRLSIFSLTSSRNSISPILSSPMTLPWWNTSVIESPSCTSAKSLNLQPMIDCTATPGTPIPRLCSPQSLNRIQGQKNRGLSWKEMCPAPLIPLRGVVSTPGIPGQWKSVNKKNPNWPIPAQATRSPATCTSPGIIHPGELKLKI